MVALLIQAFFWGVCLSFVGSIGPGMITLRIWEISVGGAPRTAINLIIGVAFAEILYASVALYIGLLAYQLSVFYPYVYFLVAFFVLFYAYRTSFVSTTAFSTKQSATPFRRGVFLGLSNLLPIPFWIAATLYAQEWKLLDLSRMYACWSYVFGIGVGTWLFLRSVVYVSRKFSFLYPKERQQKRIFSWAYIAVALYFAYKGMYLL